eukprot:9141539-Ditylum_brightwellii.AAC.1
MASYCGNANEFNLPELINNTTTNAKSDSSPMGRSIMMLWSSSSMSSLPTTSGLTYSVVAAISGQTSIGIVQIL